MSKERFARTIDYSQIIDDFSLQMSRELVYRYAQISSSQLIKIARNRIDMINQALRTNSTHSAREALTQMELSVAILNKRGRPTPFLNRAIKKQKQKIEDHIANRS
jgi:hypothetical protein